MKKNLFVMALMLTSLMGMAADDLQQFVPSNYGGWQNLSISVNDTSYYTSDPLPMQAAVSGKTVHVFWTDWKPNAEGDYCVYYRRSTDAGKTWEDPRAIFKSKTMKMFDVNYVGGTFGTNAKWFNVEGQNVQVVTIQESEDGKYSELYYIVSNDDGKTFETRQLVKGGENYHFGRPHVVIDGQTVVVAFQQSRYGSSPYHTRVLTSFDGGQTFSDKEIDLSQRLVDVQVSGQRWLVLGDDDDWNNGMLRGNVYVSTSADGGETVATENVAPIVIDVEREGWDDRSWGSLEYMKGGNGDSYNYHPQITLEGDVINVVFRGCAEAVEGKRPTNDRNHTIFRRSIDFGKTWTDPIYLPESNGSDCAIVAKGEHVYVLQAVNGPLMTYSHDGGETWDIQKRSYWAGSSNGYGNFYELYMAPDDASGEHVYWTGVRGILVESKDGFRTVERNFSIGTESWYGGRSNNHSLTVLLDGEGTEHWVMNYQAPYKSFESYFWNIVYRRNDPAPATTGKEMALDISEIENSLDRPLTNVVIPMTPSLMATAEATTVECWVRVDQDNRFQIASLTNDAADHKGSVYYGGWSLEVDGSDGWFSFCANLSTEQSIDGKGVGVWDRWRLQVKEWGKWHHVALTYDSRVEKDNVRLYADGVLLGTATESGKIKMGSNPIVIGRADTYYDPKGLVDNFSIWSRALTQEEIQSHIYNAPDGKDKDCRLLLTFDGSLQDQSQYHNDPAPLMDAVLVEHDGIRPPHPDFTMTKDVTGQNVYVNDLTNDGEGCWWILPYPGKYDDYKTSDQRHVSQNFKSNPGTYSYTLVAKGTGNCNAYASTSQTITIGGLSKVFPEMSGQETGVRLTIQGGYSLTEYSQPTVLLHKEGKTIEGEWMVGNGYNSKNVQSADDLAKALFDLSEAEPGKYDVVVGNDTLYSAFTIEESEEPNVWMNVSGWNRQLWNKWKDYTIEYGNNSNAPAYNVPIFIMVSDRKGTVDVEFDFDYELCNPALDDYGLEIAQQLGDHVMAYDKTMGDSVQVYSFMIPYIAPNSVGHKTFRMRHRQDESARMRGQKLQPAWNPYLEYLKKWRNVDIIYWIEAPWGPFDPDAPNPYQKARTRAPYTMEQGECIAKELGTALFETAIGFVPGVNCMYSIGKTAYQSATEVEKPWSTFGSNYLSTFFSCCEDLIPGAALAQAAFTLGSLAWNFYSAGSSMSGCLNGDPKKLGVDGVGSYDPNEMIGPSGYDDEAHYIQPIGNMAYTITYENKSTATAPAHEVYVSDKLDLTKFDAETFGFTSFGWADTTIVVGGSYTKEFTRDIKYNVNGEDIIVRVSGTFDKETGEAKWSMVSLDKDGKEIEDPAVGYLLPNNDEHVGEGFVSFSITHLPNPANGSTVSNKASIVFDANAPIETNVYTNTFDTDYPTSQITGVTRKGNELTVSFQGSDATSGIDSYSLYYFTDEGEPALLLSGISEPQITITVEEGAVNGLCVIAVDHAGWREAKDLKPEYLPGDANGDGVIDVKDLDTIVHYAMTGDAENFVFMNADANGDQKVNIADIVFIVNILRTE